MIVVELVPWDAAGRPRLDGDAAGRPRLEELTDEAVERAITALNEAGARALELFDDQTPPVVAALFERFGGRERAVLSAAGFGAGALRVREASQVESSDRWAFAPLWFDPLWIVPPNRAVPSGGRALILDSVGEGVFGSGAHSTTALCLERIISLSPIDSLLDVGTGSGILALAALALGAKQVTATDTDRAALELARRNAAANGLTAGLEFSIALPDKKYSVIAANILASALDGLAPSLVQRLDSGGTIILSGVRAGELEELARIYRNFGLRRLADEERDGWYRLEFIASW